jgi:hypothetical protein
MFSLFFIFKVFQKIFSIGNPAKRRFQGRNGCVDPRSAYCDADEEDVAFCRLLMLNFV